MNTAPRIQHVMRLIPLLEEVDKRLTRNRVSKGGLTLTVIYLDLLISHFWPGIDLGYPIHLDRLAHLRYRLMCNQDSIYHHNPKALPYTEDLLVELYDRLVNHFTALEVNLWLDGYAAWGTLDLVLQSKVRDHLTRRSQQVSS